MYMTNAAGMSVNCIIKNFVSDMEMEDDYNIKSVKSVKVDGKKVKENVWYTLKMVKLQK